MEREIKKQNPFKLIWYRKGWSQSKVDRNNVNFWNWEIKYNDFVPPNSTTIKIEKPTPTPITH